nr:MAG TPA: hypothetical protein [Caudoviricetes sp.]
METRKVTIINNKTQKQSVIQASSATNLGELKAEMRELGINYEGMTFFEGHMRAELKDDAAPLPTNIPYKGQIVNDLTFLLTAPEKKIKSGAMTRSEAYDAIKANGLQSACVVKFGKNFTMCKTQDLIDLIESQGKKEAKVEAPAPAPVTKKAAKKPVAEAKKEEAAPVAPAAPASGNCEEALKALVEDLYCSGTIEGDTYDKVMGLLNGGASEAPASEKMSKRDIDEMFAFAK